MMIPSLLSLSQFLIKTQSVFQLQLTERLKVINLNLTRMKFGGSTSFKGNPIRAIHFRSNKFYSDGHRHIEDRGHWYTFSKRREVNRWVLTFIIGVFCGIVATFVTFFTKLLTSFKYSIFNHLLEKEKNQEMPYGVAFIALCMINLSFASVAWFTRPCTRIC